MSGLPSDEVAEDYKGSLEDLVTNDRYQISNLTLIAKENTEHAEAISRVLQNHINRVCKTPFCHAARLTRSQGSSCTEIARIIRTRLNSQKCRIAVHGVFWPEPSSDLHACLFSGGRPRSSKVGGDVENVARASARLIITHLRLPKRQYTDHSRQLKQISVPNASSQSLSIYTRSRTCKSCFRSTISSDTHSSPAPTSISLPSCISYQKSSATGSNSLRSTTASVI